MAENILTQLELDEIVQDGIQVMEWRIRDMGIDLTGALRNSIRGQVIQEAANAYAEITIFFNAYGRFKDMKSLRMPPSSLPNPAGEYIEAIQNYIEKVGIGRFAYIPGYQNSKKIPTANIALKRLTWGIAIGRWGKGTVYRRGRGWYNDTKSKIMRDIKKNFQAKVSFLTFKTIQESLSL